MKKSAIYILSLLAVSIFWGCKKNNYPGGTLSSYISLYDLRDVFKGQDITISKDNLFGAEKIAGVVTSDHSGGNMPPGILTLQDSRRQNLLRGISLQLGADASKYIPGDSLIIDVSGSVLKRVDGVLQLTGIPNSNITKVVSGRPLTPLAVKASDVISNPTAYESVLVSLYKVGFDPTYTPGSTYAGDRTINDSYGNLTLHTEAAAPFANRPLPFLSNFTGIIFNTADNKSKLWPRSESDIVVTSSTAPKIAPAIITGFLTDPSGSDGNYEYIQLLATKNIDFAATPFSIVTTNNAGASTPTGFPTNGWATGDLRTYKMDITSGTVASGQYFYVGANKNIWGFGSTDMSSSKWFGKQYATLDGDGFGTKTSNLLANSGNGAGIAVFDKTTVDASAIPVDVIFFGGAGSLYTPGPPEKGYRITNTDYYDDKHPSSQAVQPYYTQGSNMGKFAFPTVVSNVGGYFAKLGGKYNKTTGRWATVRSLTNVLLTATSTVAEIEGSTTVEQ